MAQILSGDYLIPSCLKENGACCEVLLLIGFNYVKPEYDNNIKYEIWRLFPGHHENKEWKRIHFFKMIDFCPEKDMK